MVFFFSSSMIIQQKGNTPIFIYTILRNFKKNFSIYVDVQMVNSVNNDEYRNTYHIAHDNRTANTRKCLGIAAFGWWITDNNAFYLRKQLKNASKHFISLRWPTRERWRTVVFKCFLWIFRQKQIHVEPMSETEGKFCFSARKEMSSTKSLLRSQIWADI